MSHEHAPASVTERVQAPVPEQLAYEAELIRRREEQVERDLATVASYGDDGMPIQSLKLPPSLWSTESELAELFLSESAGEISLDYSLACEYCPSLSVLATEVNRQGEGVVTFPMTADGQAAQEAYLNIYPSHSEVESNDMEELPLTALERIRLGEVEEAHELTAYDPDGSGTILPYHSYEAILLAAGEGRSVFSVGRIEELPDGRLACLLITTKYFSEEDGTVSAETCFTWAEPGLLLALEIPISDASFSGPVEADFFASRGIEADDGSVESDEETLDFTQEKLGYGYRYKIIEIAGLPVLLTYSEKRGDYVRIRHEDAGSEEAIERKIAILQGLAEGEPYCTRTVYLRDDGRYYYSSTAFTDEGNGEYGETTEAVVLMHGEVLSLLVEFPEIRMYDSLGNGGGELSREDFLKREDPLTYRLVIQEAGGGYEGVCSLLLEDEDASAEGLFVPQGERVLPMLIDGSLLPQQITGPDGEGIENVEEAVRLLRTMKKEQKPVEDGGDDVRAVPNEYLAPILANPHMREEGSVTPAVEEAPRLPVQVRRAAPMTNRSAEAIVHTSARLIPVSDQDSLEDEQESELPHLGIQVLVAEVSEEARLLTAYQETEEILEAPKAVHKDRAAAPLPPAPSLPIKIGSSLPLLIDEAPKKTVAPLPVSAPKPQSLGLKKVAVTEIPPGERAAYLVIPVQDLQPQGVKAPLAADRDETPPAAPITLMLSLNPRLQTGDTSVVRMAIPKQVVERTSTTAQKPASIPTVRVHETQESARPGATKSVDRLQVVTNVIPISELRQRVGSDEARDVAEISSAQPASSAIVGSVPAERAHPLEERRPSQIIIPQEKARPESEMRHSRTPEAVIARPRISIPNITRGVTADPSVQPMQQSIRAAHMRRRQVRQQEAQLAHEVHSKKQGRLGRFAVAGLEQLPAQLYRVAEAAAEQLVARYGHSGQARLSVGATHGPTAFFLSVTEGGRTLGKTELALPRFKGTAPAAYKMAA